MSTTRQMSDLHEAFLADLFQGRATRGSGSTGRDPADGKQQHKSGEYVFAWDGKSTLGRSIGVTKEMWEKITWQADPYRPMIPLRFYANARLTAVELDLVVASAHDVAAMQEDANLYHRIKAES